MANSTLIHIPDNVDDKIVLRRTLDKIVQSIDELKGNRGDSEAAKASQLVSTATSLDELRKDFNKLDLSYVRSDGKGEITAPLTYSEAMEFTNKQLISKEAAVALNSTLKDETLSDVDKKLDTFVVKETQPSPTPLATTATLGDVITAVNDLLLILKNTKLLS